MESKVPSPIIFPRWRDHPRSWPESFVTCDLIRASPAATVNAATNAGTPIIIGQIRSARPNKRWLPVPVLSAWMLAAAARLNAPTATDNETWSAVLRGELRRRKYSNPMWITNTTAQVNHAARRHMNCVLFEADGLGKATPTIRYTVPNSITQSHWYVPDAFRSM